MSFRPLLGGEAHRAADVLLRVGADHDGQLAARDGRERLERQVRRRARRRRAAAPARGVGLGLVEQVRQPLAASFSWFFSWSLSALLERLQLRLLEEPRDVERRPAASGRPRACATGAFTTSDVRRACRPGG